MKKSSIYAGIGFGLFCLGYMLINEQILVQAILYRAAASDYHSALIAFTAMALQATALLIGLIVLPNRLFWLIVILIGISAVTNLIFSQIRLVADRIPPCEKCGRAISYACCHRSGEDVAGARTLCHLPRVVPALLARSKPLTRLSACQCLGNPAYSVSFLRLRP